MADGHDVLTEQACPSWCERPAGHDVDSTLRGHRAAAFDLDERAHVSVVEVACGQHHGVGELAPAMIDVEFWVKGTFDDAETRQIHDALQAAYRRRDEIAATLDATM
jgi:hypothetical protein